MEINSFVVAYIHSPRERWWGLLRALSPAGLTLRGLSLESFEPWARSVARREELDMGPSTVFFPMHRVERMYEDEATLLVPSHADRFLELTGRDVRLHLLSTPEEEQ